MGNNGLMSYEQSESNTTKTQFKQQTMRCNQQNEEFTMNCRHPREEHGDGIDTHGWLKVMTLTAGLLMSGNSHPS